MKCEQCVQEGRKSRLYAPTSSFVTAMMHHPYYDEDGNYHVHDGNWRSSEWSSSNRHRWSVSSQGRCPQGDFGGARNITVLDVVPEPPEPIKMESLGGTFAIVSSVSSDENVLKWESTDIAGPRPT